MFFVLVILVVIIFHIAIHAVIVVVVAAVLFADKFVVAVLPSSGCLAELFCRGLLVVGCCPSSLLPASAMVALLRLMVLLVIIPSYSPLLVL